MPLLGFIHSAHHSRKQFGADWWQWGVYASLPRMLCPKEPRVEPERGPDGGVRSHLRRRGRMLKADHQHLEEHLKSWKQWQWQNAGYLGVSPVYGGRWWKARKQPHVRQSSIYWGQRVPRGAQAASIRVKEEKFTNNFGDTERHEPILRSTLSADMKVNWC